MKQITLNEVKNLLDNLLKVKLEDRDEKWEQVYNQYVKLESNIASNQITYKILKTKILQLEETNNKIKKLLQYVSFQSQMQLRKEMSDDWVEVFLDLQKYRGKEINYNKDPLFLKLAKIRDGR